MRCETVPGFARDAGAFSRAFRTRWLFDVEILARLIQARRGTRLPPVEDLVYAFPLHEWHDVAGSKVKPWGFFRAFFGLGLIYWPYFAYAQH
jgi:hypothetical protein